MNGMYPIEKGSKFLFNTTILLWSTGSSALKCDSHPSLFACLFKILTFSGTVTSGILNTKTILSFPTLHFSFLNFLLKNNSMQSQCSPNKCFLPPQVGVKGEQIYKNGLSIKILEHSTALLLTLLFLSLPKA